jgi:hypothetical protein
MPRISVLPPRAALPTPEDVFGDSSAHLASRSEHLPDDTHGTTESAGFNRAALVAATGRPRD